MHQIKLAFWFISGLSIRASVRVTCWSLTPEEQFSGSIEMSCWFRILLFWQVEHFLLKSQAECRCAEKYCDRLKIYKISEGLYRIGDRNVFIRVWHFSLTNFSSSTCYYYFFEAHLFSVCLFVSPSLVSFSIVIQGSSRHGPRWRRMVWHLPLIRTY